MPDNKNDKIKQSSKRLEKSMDELIKVFDSMIDSFKKNLKPQQEDN